MFAIQNIEESIGKIEAYKVNWVKNEEEPLGEQVNLVDCNELLEDGTYEG